MGQRLAGRHLLWVGIWLGGENIEQLDSMHWYIGYSQKIAGSGFVGQPPEYFPVYLEFGKCGCARFVEPAPRIFSGIFMILKMWVHQVYGTGPWCIFGHILILKMQMHGFVGKFFWPCRIFSGYLEC
jgi:hypothetical protein